MYTKTLERLGPYPNPADWAPQAGLCQCLVAAGECLCPSQSVGLSAAPVWPCGGPPTQGCLFPKLSVPPSLQGPSGEPGQILLGGIAKKISLYHGFYEEEIFIDRELDWHIHIDVPKWMKDTLIAHLRSKGCIITNKYLEDVYSELMVLDSPNRIGPDLGYRSGDVSLALRLRGSQHPAWDLGLIAAKHAGKKSRDFSKYSQLVADQGYVYLQGAFVNDIHHKFQLEIHPLDSIVFAMDRFGKTLSTVYGQNGWPNNFVRWRVAVFTNSTVHRINKCSYLKKERTTTWYLDLPSDYYKQSKTPRLKSLIPHKLWNGVSKAYYNDRSVKSFTHNLETDPRDGRKKLKVSVTMKPPDALGGIFVRDYFLFTS
jgi:hypothetical protein